MAEPLSRTLAQTGVRIRRPGGAAVRARWRWAAAGGLAVAGVLAATVWSTLPHGTVSLGAGPEGGTYAQHAAAYAAELDRLGVASRIVHIGDSLEIIERVNGPCPCLDVGFTAQQVDPARYPEVVSAGAIELQPLFLFVRKGLAPADMLAALQGRQVVAPLERSATSQAARDLLQHFGVQPAALRYHPIREAAALLRRGDADAGFFMLSPASPLIAELMADDGLVLFSFDASLGISRQIDYLQPARLARGAFSLARDLPPRDVQLVAASVNVVVRRDIHPVVLYALLNAMKAVHRGQTLVSDHGDYPNMVRTALPVHDKAEAWARNGTPWLYDKLPPLLASPLDEYWGMALFIVAVSSVFGTLGTVLQFGQRVYGTVRRTTHAGARLLQRRLQARPRQGAVARGLLRLCAAVLPGEVPPPAAR